MTSITFMLCRSTPSKHHVLLALMTPGRHTPCVGMFNHAVMIIFLVAHALWTVQDCGESQDLDGPQQGGQSKAEIEDSTLCSRGLPVIKRLRALHPRRV